MGASDGALGVVVIGRNEGDRLKKCIAALPRAWPAVYVDSGSTDLSIKVARAAGLAALALDSSTPFTAARARNVGFQYLSAHHAQLAFVQFLDGDCELHSGWLERGRAFLLENPEVGAVAGLRRERFPDRSVYNKLCDLEWSAGSFGEVSSIGGDAMIRVNALAAANGYRDDYIAGEEPELCFRLRAVGWKIVRLNSEMTLHDAEMKRFGQWWKRTVRSGYAFALGASDHGAGRERFRVWECFRPWLWTVLLPFAILASVFAFGPMGWFALLAFPVQITRQALRTRGAWRERLLVSFFQLIARPAELQGQLQFVKARITGRQKPIIEYK